MGSPNFFVRCGLALAIAAAACVWHASRAQAFATGPACSEKSFLAPSGIGFRILFANNGTVQRYIVTGKDDDPEAINDARLALETTYGPAGVNAPALKIISFRPGDNGMQVPDKAIDSCGRTLDFQ